MVGLSQLNFAQPFATLQSIDPSTGNEPYELVAGDLDGDGDQDLVMGTYDYNGGTPAQDYIKWYKNDGAGNFTVEATISSTIFWVDGLTVANIDGQFGDDIIATSISQNKLVYFLSDGAGGFSEEVIVDDALSGPGSVVAGDINADGNIDLATVSYSDNRTVWYSGDGAGNFVLETPIDDATTDGPNYLDIADFDGDSDLDIVVGFFNTQSLEIFYNQYIESGSTSVSWIKDTVTVDSGGNYLLEVMFADVNNDGALDVLKVDNTNGEVAWYNKIKNGASTKTLVQDTSIISRPGAVEVVDLDGDGFNEVIVTDSGSNDDAIVYFQGVNNASPSETPTVVTDNNYQIFSIAVADFDGDSDLDIASLGNNADRLDWYANERIVLSTNNHSVQKLSVSPNPTSNVLNFKGLTSDNQTVQVYDVVGKLVLTSNLSSNGSLDVSNLSNGFYTLLIGDEQHTLKFIKK